ncbi:hypothetical protein SUT380_21010 (plasmid) [Streptococcus parasuis]|nr:hypothetical protein SUT380_21010 [Streptococcus parasuis]
MDLNKSKKNNLQITKKILLALQTLIGICISGIIIVIGFIVATPLLLLSILINWIKLSIRFAIFWFICDLIYVSIILDSQNFEPFNNFIILVIIILGFIGSIFVTISEMRD